jgi:hypothetical protein
MKVLFTLAAVAASLAIPASASQAGTGAAELVDVSGKVLVNLGKGYVPAKNDALLDLGTEIFVAEDSGATLHFLNSKCKVELAPASITRVSGTDMCQQASRNTATFYGADGEVVVTPVNGTVIPGSIAPTGIISPYYIAGGIFVINASAFTYSVLQKDLPVSAP